METKEIGLGQSAQWLLMVERQQHNLTIAKPREGKVMKEENAKPVGGIGAGGGT
ncbi:MAG: hypothetical protein ABI856_04190 [Nitrospira sp.]